MWSGLVVVHCDRRNQGLLPWFHNRTHTAGSETHATLFSTGSTQTTMPPLQVSIYSITSIDHTISPDTSRVPKTCHPIIPELKSIGSIPLIAGVPVWSKRLFHKSEYDSTSPSLVQSLVGIIVYQHFPHVEKNTFEFHSHDTSVISAAK
jgi:hypothetical protein